MAEQIHLQQRDVRQLSSADQYGFLVTNPPYGERLSDQETVAALYQEMRPVFDRLSTWSYSIITALPAFEAIWGKPADKRRKLYNGMLKTTLYQYLGPKPPKRPKVAGQDRL